MRKEDSVKYFSALQISSIKLHDVRTCNSYLLNKHDKKLNQIIKILGFNGIFNIIPRIFVII